MGSVRMVLVFSVLFVNTTASYRVFLRLVILRLPAVFSKRALISPLVITQFAVSLMSKSFCLV